MTEAIIEEYTSTLSDLKQNSKPMINALTMLAVDNQDYAKHIVGMIESRIQKVNGKEKLPILYLMDSIIKNSGGIYLRCFSVNLVQTFVGAFSKVDEKTRESMFKLRSTWNGIFQDASLHALDKKVKGIDPAWPIVTPKPKPTPVPSVIHVNPKFIKKEQEVKKPEPQLELDLLLQQRKSEDEMRKALIEKQQQLLQLKRKELEFELEQTKLRLETQNMELAIKNKRLEAQNRLLTIGDVTPPTEMVVEEPATVEEQPWMRHAAVSTLKTPLQETFVAPPVSAPAQVPLQTARDPRLASRDPRLARRDPRIRNAPTSNTQQVIPQTIDPPKPVSQPSPTIPTQVIPQNPPVSINPPQPLLGKTPLLPIPFKPRSILKNANEKTPVGPNVQNMDVSDNLVNQVHPALRDIPGLRLHEPGQRMPVPGGMPMPGQRMPMPAQIRDRGPMHFNGPMGVRPRREGPGFRDNLPGKEFPPERDLPPGRDFPPNNNSRINTHKDRLNERTYKDEFGRDVVDNRDERERREDERREERRRMDRTDRERERRRNDRFRETRRDERNNDDRKDHSRRDSKERDRGKSRSSRRRSVSPYRRSRSPRDRRERSSRSEKDKKENKPKEKKSDEGSKEDESQSDTSEKKQSVSVKKSEKSKEEDKSKTIEEKSSKRKSDVIDATKITEETTAKKAKIQDDDEGQAKIQKNNGKWEEEPWCERLGPTKDVNPKESSEKKSSSNENRPKESANQSPSRNTRFEESPAKDSPDSPVQDERSTDSHPMIVDRSPPLRRVSIDPSVKIPKELSAQMLPKILANAGKQLDSGQIDHKQHQELLSKLSEVYKFQQQKTDEMSWQRSEALLSPIRKTTSKDKDERVRVSKDIPTDKDKNVHSEKPQDKDMRRKDDTDMRKLGDKDDRKMDTKTVEEEEEMLESGSDVQIPMAIDQDMRNLPKAVDKDERRSSINKEKKSEEDLDMRKQENKKQILHSSDSDKDERVKSDRDFRQKRREGLRSSAANETDKDERMENLKKNQTEIKERDSGPDFETAEDPKPQSDFDSRFGHGMHPFMQIGAPANAKQETSLTGPGMRDLGEYWGQQDPKMQQKKTAKWDKWRSDHPEHFGKEDPERIRQNSASEDSDNPFGMDLGLPSKDVDERVFQRPPKRELPPSDMDMRTPMDIDSREMKSQVDLPSSGLERKPEPPIHDALLHPVDREGRRLAVGPDGKLVIGDDGKLVKLGADGRLRREQEIRPHIQEFENRPDRPPHPNRERVFEEHGRPLLNRDGRPAFERERRPAFDRRPIVDRDGRPVFDRDGRPVFDRDGRPVFDRDGRPIHNRDGRPLIDRDGRPLLDRDGRPVLDRDGRPVLDRDGRPVVDRDGRPVVDRDGRPVVDRDGRPFLDRNGRPIFERDRRPILDRDGRPVFERDRRPFHERDRRPGLDRDGRVFNRDERRLLERDRRPVIDRDGRPIIDRDGRPILNRGGRPPLPLGADGKPLPMGLPLGPDGRPLPLPLGPDGRPLPLGPDGRPLPLGPDGRPLPLGPDGRPLPIELEKALPLGPDGRPLQLGPDGLPIPGLPGNPMHFTMEMIVNQAVQNVTQMIGRNIGIPGQRYITPGLDNQPASTFPLEPTLPPQQEPIQTQGDVNSLFAKLLETGIITKKTVPVEKAERSDSPSVAHTESEKKEVKPDEKADSDNEEYERDLTIPPITFDLKDLKERYPGVIKSIYSGTQCKSCGLRFTINQMDGYRKHLDWHFKLNRKDRDDVKARTSRRWFLSSDSWIVYENFDNLQEGAETSFFEEQAVQMKVTEFKVSSVPIIPGNDKDDICKVCHEPFQQFWDEDEEQWQLKDAVRIDNKTYHPTCYQDAKENSLLEPPTPSDGMLSPPFKFKSDLVFSSDAPVAKLFKDFTETEPMDISTSRDKTNVTKTVSENSTQLLDNLQIKKDTEDDTPSVETVKDSTMEQQSEKEQKSEKDQENVESNIEIKIEKDASSAGTGETANTVVKKEPEEVLTSNTDEASGTDTITDSVSLEQSKKEIVSQSEIKTEEELSDPSNISEVESKESNVAAKADESTEDEAAGDLKIDTDSPAPSNEEDTPVPVMNAIQVVGGLPRTSLRSNKGRIHRDW